jgi:thymidylate kinase
MTASQNLTKAKFFLDVIQVLEQEDHKLCILHGYADYPEIISSDVDAISSYPSQIPHIFAKHNIASMVQVLQHEATAFYYVLSRFEDNQLDFIALDVSTDYRRNGRVFFRGEEFLADSQPFKFFQVPTPELEFAYYIVKKVAKGELNADQSQRLSELFRTSPDPCHTQLMRFFPEAESKVVADAAQSGNWEPVQNQMHSLRLAMLGKVGKENLLSVFKYWTGDLRRRIKRILQPTGLMIVVLGADGSGKSTVIDRVKDHLTPAFRRTQYIHLRPRLGIAESANSVPVIDPHGQPPRSWLASVLKLFYFLIDYGVGYAVKIYPQLVRSTFVIFDRYYHDLLVDPKRYRYGGSMWLARLFGLLMPKPDLWILLDAPAEVLQARKQEVSFSESLRQREAYLNLISRQSNGHVVDASKPVGEVIKQVEKLILEHLSERTSTRLGLKKY